MYGRRPEARPRLGLEKQPAVAAQWVARAMFVDARSHVGDPRRGSPCTVGSAGGQSITTVRQAPVGAIDYRLHAPRPEEGQSSAATGYAGALAPKAPPRRQLAGVSQARRAGAPASQPAERQSSAPATPAPSHPKPLHAGDCTNQPTIHHPIEPLRTPSTSPPGTQKPTPLDPLHQGGVFSLV